MKAPETMNTAIKILIIENSASDIEFIQYELKKSGINYIFEIVQNEADYINALENFTPDIILSDYALPTFDGHTAFEIRKQIAPETPFIFVSGTIGEERSVEYIKNGLTDYVLKDKLFTLIVKVKRALEEAKATRQKNAAEESIKKSEMFFRVLIEKSKEMITLGNREGEIVYASPFVTIALGYSAEELIDTQLYDIVHPDDIPQFRKSRDKLLENPGSSFDFRHRRKHKNGNWVWCEGTITNMLDEPAVNAMVTNFRDISERKRAEQDILDANENLKKALNDLQKIMDASLDMICSIDEQGTFVKVSKASSSILGYQPDELIGTNFIDLVAKEDVTRTLNTDSGIKGGFPVPVFENRYRHKEGNIVDMLWSANWDANDKMIYCIAKDITERKNAEKQQEFDRNNLDALINTTNDHIWSVDRELNLITFNQEFNRVAMQRSGRKIEKGSNIRALGFPAEFEERHKRAFAGEIFTEVDHVTTPVEKWIEVSFYPIRERDEVVGTACYASDITKEKEAERQLGKSEMFSRGILNALSSHIAVVDNQGNIVRVNESWRRFGIENGVTTLERCGEGSNYFDMCEQAAKAGDETATEVLRGMKDVISGQIPQFYLEYPCYTPSKQLWFGLRAMKFESYEPMIVVSHLDISERKIAEKKLVDSESRLKEAQDIARVGNFELDMLNYTEVWSDEMFKILGIVPHEVTPSMGLFLSFIHPEDKDFLQKGFSECMRTLQGLPFDFRFIRKDGSIRYGYTQAVFELSKDQKPLRLFGILQDVTDKKLAEIERTKIFNELQLRNSELEQFAYVASHDLQEPLRMITSFMNLLEKKYSALLDEKGKQYIDFAVDGAKRMREIILDLLNFSRVGKTEDELEKVDFNHLMNEIVALYRRRIQEVGACILFENLPSIRTYKTPIRQVLQNLVSNSLKYCKANEPPVIKIDCIETPSHFEFSVKDNGIGIASEYFDKIFIIFQRLHNKNEYSGTGMGLAIVKKIVENLGGKIWVESEEGKGSTFFFTLIKNQQS
jgi:PAS domain S-box-containing protein